MILARDGERPRVVATAFEQASARNFELELDRYPEIRTEFALIGLGTAGQVNQGLVIVRMLPREERRRSQHEVIGLVRRDLAAIPGARAFASPFSVIESLKIIILPF